MQNFDTLIIGFGKAGKTLAGYLAASGKKVAVVEKSKEMYGGTCINVGCIPTKSLVHSSDIAIERNLKTFEEKAAFYQTAYAEKQRVVEMLREKNYQKLVTNPNITIFDGEASFRSPHEVAVRAGDAVTVVSAETICINTGSVSRMPDIAGIHESRNTYTSSGLLGLSTLPRRLIIIGSGFIGLEFASMYQRFGSEVTVLVHGDTFLPKEDPEIARTIFDSLEGSGIRFVFGVEPVSIADNAKTAVVTAEVGAKTETFTAEAVLIATGRVPATEGLNLAAAGVETGKNGAVKVNEYLQTTAPHIYAMGDVTGGPQFTYVSLDDYRVVKAALDGTRTHTTAKRLIPTSVFIHPPYARVGLNETEAKAAGIKIKTAVMPAAAVPKAHVLRDPAGLLKAVVDANTGKILGAMLVCEEANEMINIIKLAMDADMSYTVLRDQIYTHPVMTEALNDLFSMIQ